MKSPRTVFVAIAALPVVLACAAGCGRASTAEKTPASEPSVQVTRAKSGSLSRSISIPASVRAYQEAILYAKVSGYLQSIRVDEGDDVQRGELLAEIEVPELAADCARAEAEVRAADVEYKRVREALERSPDLVVPQAVDAAKAKCEIAKANNARVETLLGYSKIVAPFSGVVTKRWVDPGALVPAATSSSTPKGAAVVSIADYSRVRIRVAIPDTEVQHIVKGLPVEITASELSGRAFRGEIARFAHVLDEATKTMSAEIEIPNLDGALRPGMFVSVRIHVDTKKDGIIIPAEAIVTEKDKLYVFTVESDIAKKRPISVGFDDGIRVEVTAGLDIGQLVVLAGKQNLTDGQRVAAVEVP